MEERERQLEDSHTRIEIVTDKALMKGKFSSAPVEARTGSRVSFPLLPGTGPFNGVHKLSNGE